MILPFTYPWIVKKHLDDSKSILDVGSGDGAFMKQINEGRYIATGVELFQDYINLSKATGAYKKIIKKDINKMTFKKNEFDAVLCSQVIEHVTKKDADKLFKKMENFAKKVVVIGTPNGEFEQHEYDGNKLQEHLSHWNVSDFEKRGYKVYGQALKFIYGEDGLLSKPIFKNQFAKYSLFFLSYILSPIAYYFPKYGAHLIAVKKL